VALKSFLAWCVRVRLIEENPARHIKRYKQERDRRHRRAAFTDQQLTRLLDVTKASGMVFRGIFGDDRAELYHAAACTGLRIGTLRKVVVGQFHVAETDAVAFVRVYAEQLKDAEDLTVPIAPDSAARLRRYFAGRGPNETAFKTPRRLEDAVQMLRCDLAEAGIPYCTTADAGNGRVRRTRVLDFHSFRKTFGTRCARAGVPLTTLQRWMGHSTPVLTANIYSEVVLEDTPELLLRIPSIARDGGHVGSKADDKKAA
jgi:integrase